MLPPTTAAKSYLFWAAQIKVQSERRKRNYKAHGAVSKSYQESRVSPQSVVSGMVEDVTVAKGRGRKHIVTSTLANWNRNSLKTGQGEGVFAQHQDDVDQA